jgi:uncharacterized protein (DUF58 family)
MPAKLPSTLQWRRLKVRPTRYGIVFMLLLAGMFLGSINYHNNLGFLLTFLLGSMTFVSIARTYKNLAGLSIVSAGTEPVFAGQQAVFSLTVDGAGKYRYGIAFGFRGAKPARHDIPAGTKSRVNVAARAFSRGLFDPGPLTLSCDYPLGLFRVQSKINQDLECVVYPNPIAGSVNTIAEKNSAGGGEQVGGPGADDFQGLKGYLPGDPLQRISWRASSRGQGLFTKDFNGQYGSSVYLDWYALAGADAEHKLSLLCRWILTAHHRNLTYGLKLPGSTLEPGNGQIHKNRCLKALALFSN